MPYEQIVTVPSDATNGQIPIADGSGGFSWGDQSGGSDASLGITGASVGQIAKVTAVDSDGKPTAWSPADMPSGGGGEIWEKIAEIPLTQGVAVYNLASLRTYQKVRISGGKISSVTSGNNWLAVNDASGALIKRILVPTNTISYAFKSYWVYRTNLFCTFAVLTSNNMLTPQNYQEVDFDEIAWPDDELTVQLAFSDAVAAAFEDGASLSVYGVHA